MYWRPAGAQVWSRTEPSYNRHGCFHRQREGTIRIAAVQLEPAVGDVAENLRRCRALGDEAGAAGAEWIILPEFFTTGMGFLDAIADAALPPDGAGTQLLRELAARHRAVVGGSFICRDEDGQNRNAWFLVAPDGRVLGRHDKDIPTMWENCFYIGGSDNGVIDADDIAVGAAVCWEFMRTQTVRRLRDRVDLIVGGSAWWSIPRWPPAALTRRLEAANARTAAAIAPAMARAVAGAGRPCGPLRPGAVWDATHAGCHLPRSLSGRRLHRRQSRRRTRLAGHQRWARHRDRRPAARACHPDARVGRGLLAAPAWRNPGRDLALPECPRPPLVSPPHRPPGARAALPRGAGTGARPSWLDRQRGRAGRREPFLESQAAARAATFTAKMSISIFTRLDTKTPPDSSA